MQGNHQQAADLAALWQQCQEAGAAAEAWCKGDRDFHQAPTYERYIVAYDALKAARPTDLLGIAAQLEWAADWIGDGGGDPGDEEILEHMAQSLKALVLRPVPVVTDAMVAAGMEAEIAHRHVSAEQRVRAMLADALSAMPPVEDDQTAPRLWEGVQGRGLAHQRGAGRRGSGHSAVRPT